MVIMSNSDKFYLLTDTKANTIANSEKKHSDLFCTERMIANEGKKTSDTVASVKIQTIKN